MMYTIIISFLIEKPFHLLRSQSFSFQIVSEFIDTLTPCFVPRGGLLYTMIVRGGLLPSSRVPGGMVLDEIDTCIMGVCHCHATANKTKESTI